MIEVSNWTDLVSEISAITTEDKDISLSSDIVLDDDILSSINRPNNKYTITIHGNGHKIQNLYCDKNIVVFNGYSRKKLIFQDIFFDSAQIENGMLFRDVTLDRCQLSCELIDAQLNYGVKFNQCGLNIVGYGINSVISLSDDKPSTNCNIEIHGAFRELCFTLNHSWLIGKCGVIDKISFNGSKLSFIDTEILTEKAEVTAYDSSFLVYNKEKLKGIQMPSWTTGVTEQQLHDVEYLRSIGYPIRQRTEL